MHTSAIAQMTEPELHASRESQSFNEHGGVFSKYISNNSTGETKTPINRHHSLTDLPIQWLERYRLPHGKKFHLSVHCLYRCLRATGKAGSGKRDGNGNGNGSGTGTIQNN